MSEADWSCDWPAPAKLNLMLRIIGRRSDGYHELQTVFQFLGHTDRLAFRVRDDGRIQRETDLPGVPEQDDLTVRAARLLQENCSGVPGSGPLGVDIRLQKRLPMGGGLGGGSSDAATVLVALNRLWGCNQETKELARLGLKLGADVPIFVNGNAAWAEGVGERLQPVDLEQPWYLVVVPQVHVSTAEIFQAPELTRNSSTITIRAFIAGDRRNDCLPVVRERYPQVAQVMQWLADYTQPQLTGTGACVFGAFDSKVEADTVLQALPGSWKGFVARGLNRSPLLDRVNDY